MQTKRALLKSLTRAVRVVTGAAARAVARMEKKAAVYFSKSWLEKMEPWLWRFSRPTLEKLLQHEEKRISDASRATAAERRRTEALRQPMPSDPARAADDEAVLRMLWLWVGYVAYDETLSESGEEAVKRFLKRAWPKYHGSRITRSLLETWVQYAKDIKYERDAQACYGGRGWDPRRRR